MNPVSAPGTDGISNFTKKAMESSEKRYRRAAFPRLDNPLRICYNEYQPENGEKYTGIEKGGIRNGINSCRQSAGFYR